jgi:hypothetical protein
MQIRLQFHNGVTKKVDVDAVPRRGEQIQIDDTNDNPVLLTVTLVRHVLIAGGSITDVFVE